MGEAMHVAAAPAIGRAVLACGGTGGHVYPALAIARELKERSALAALSFVGRPDSFESKAVEREGFVFDALTIGRLAGQGMARRLRTLVELPAAVARAASFLGRRRPEVVIGTGGFVSGPTMLAAALRRIPIVVQEQNAIPGFTNRMLWSVADRVALAHANAESARPGSKYRVTGNPVRPAFFDIPPYSTDWAQDGGIFTLLVLGGSQGARSLNRAALEAAGILARDEAVRGRVRIVVQCGPAWEAETRLAASSLGLPVEVAAFLHDMPLRLASASLVACRSGASTVAEICAAGRPALLVPFPQAAGDHQTANARALEDAGAAERVADADFSGDALAARIRHALAHPQLLAAIAAHARELSRPDAAARVVDLAEEVLAERRMRRAS